MSVKTVEERVDEQFPPEMMDDLEKFLDEKEGWKVENEVQNITISTRKVDGIFWSRVNTENIGFSVQQLHELFIDVECRDKIAERIKDTRVVYRKEFMDVLYFQIHAPGPISNREILQCRRWKFLDGKSIDSGFVVVIKSIELEEFPKRKKPIRADCTMVRRFIPNEEDNGKTSKIESVSSYDFSGWIPTKIVNMLVKKLSAGVYEKTRLAMEYLREKQQKQQK